MRIDGRTASDLRPVNITRDFIKHAAGSVLMEMGDTRVICAATVEARVPPFLRDKKQGWITAEYAMLPASSAERIARESTRGKVGGRTHEIQRLIGRALRCVVDLAALGERTVWIDCDVIQADGGTRTAAITGAYVAMVDALDRLKQEKKLDAWPVRDALAAVSVGKVDGNLLLDLNYHEDSCAEVDMNVVMTGSGTYIEVQGTAERAPFDRKEMDGLLSLAEGGIRALIEAQRQALDG